MVAPRICGTGPLRTVNVTASKFWLRVDSYLVFVTFLICQNLQ